MGQGSDSECGSKRVKETDPCRERTLTDLQLRTQDRWKFIVNGQDGRALDVHIACVYSAEVREERRPREVPNVGAC